MAYWTDEDEVPAVWHDDPDCPNGQQIKSGNKQTGSPPAGRRKCEHCK